MLVSSVSISYLCTLLLVLTYLGLLNLDDLPAVAKNPQCFSLFKKLTLSLWATSFVHQHMVYSTTHSPSTLSWFSWSSQPYVELWGFEVVFGSRVSRDSLYFIGHENLGPFSYFLGSVTPAFQRTTVAISSLSLGSCGTCWPHSSCQQTK